MGGTRFNGLALVYELRKHGHDVLIVNRGQSEADLPLGVERLYCDRNDHSALRATLGGRDFDCIFDVSAFRRDDVEVMGEIFRGRTSHYVFISTTGIYADSQFPPISEDHPLERSDRQDQYGLNKIACEDHLFSLYRTQGFPATVVALSMVFGPNNINRDREQRMFARLRAGRPILIPGDGTTLAQVGHVDDEARALRMLMGHSQTLGRRYNLTGADYFSAEGYVDTFAEVMGVQADKIFIPADLMDEAFDGKILLTSKPPKNMYTAAPEDQTALNRSMLSCLVQHISPHLYRWNRNAIFSVERLRSDVGWSPDFTFAAAVEQTYRWFRNSGQQEQASFDFSWEDELLRHKRERS